MVLMLETDIMIKEENPFIEEVTKIPPKPLYGLSEEQWGMLAGKYGAEEFTKIVENLLNHPREYKKANDQYRNRRVIKVLFPHTISPSGKDTTMYQLVSKDLAGLFFEAVKNKLTDSGEWDKFQEEQRHGDRGIRRRSV